MVRMRRLSHILCLLTMASFMVDPVLSDDCGLAREKVREAVSERIKGTEQEALNYREAIALCPNIPEAHFDLGLIFLDQKQFSEAKESFERAISYRKDAHFLLGLASAYIGLTDLDGALRTYDDVLSLKREQASAYQGKAYVFEEQGDLEKALQALLSANEQAPTEAEVLYQLGIIYEKLGRRSDAVNSYKSALKINPSSMGASYRAALLFDEEGRVGEAYELLRKTILINTPTFEVLHALGVIAEKAGHLAEAERALQRALDLDPRSEDAAVNLGLIMLRQKKPARALEVLTAFRSEKGASARLLSALGSCELELGMYDEALADLKRAVALDPNDPATNHNLQVVADTLGLTSVPERSGLTQENSDASPRQD